MILEGKLIRADVDNGCDENKFDDKPEAGTEGR